MRKTLLAIFFATALVSFFSVTHVGATSLRVQPLSYEETLKKAEKKKGFIDVTNPTQATINLKTSVRGFKQTDNNGSLQLFESERITAGVIPDLKEFTLKPGQTMRLMFLVDGTKLPEGDVFAALMVTNTPDQTGNMAQAVQVGTLLILENGTPGARQAEVTQLNLPFFQLGTAVQGSYSIKNTAPVDSSSGFKPEVSVVAKPFTTSVKQKSSLIFAGRERANQFSLPLSRFGFYNISVSYGDSTKSQWIFIASPVWIGGIILLLAAVLVLLAFRRKHRRLSFKK